MPSSGAPGAPGCYPARPGGPWLCSTLVLSLFHAVVVPSGFSTSVQPHRWITTWWWNQHRSTQSLTDVGPPSVKDCVLLCWFHHQVVIHRWGWTLVLNPDGTTTAWNKDKTKVLHSHGPPGRSG